MVLGPIWFVASVFPSWLGAAELSEHSGDLHSWRKKRFSAFSHTGSASRNDDKIAWYENDGSQNFTPRTISTIADGAYSVFAADVDGDGDVDVLSTAVHQPRSVFAADMDSDGDTDVLSASYSDGKIAWYENDGGENFTQHTISTNAAVARTVFAADIDGDGDTDVISPVNGIFFFEQNRMARKRWQW